MADSSKEIVLKLTIDGKDAIVTLDMTEAKLKGIIPETEKLKDGYRNITAEALKYSQISDTTVDQLSQWMIGQNLTTETIEDTISQLQREVTQLNINDAAYKNHKLALDNLRGAYNKIVTSHRDVNSSQTQLIAGSSQMNMAIGQLGWVLGDANMFMVNFRMGMMSIANNIPMVVQAFVQAKTSIAGTETSMKSLVMNAIKGPGGVMLAINGLMFLLQVLPDLFGDTTESIEEQKAEVEKLKSEYEKLTRAQLQNLLVQKQMKLSELQYNPDFWDYAIAGFKNEPLPEDRSYSSRLTTLLVEIGTIKETLKYLGDQEDIENRLTINRQKIKDLNQENYKILVASAKSYDEALSSLKQWVSFDEKRLEKFSTKDSSKSRKDLVKEEFEHKKDLINIENEHQIRLAEIQGQGELIILAMKRGHLEELKRLYIQYGKDVSEITNAIAENEIQFNVTYKESKPQIPVENPEDISLGDIALADLDRLRAENIQNEFDRQRALADFEFAMMQEKYEGYENYNEIKLELEKQHSDQLESIERSRKVAQLEIAKQTLNTLAGMFNENTAAFKAIAIAQAIINTYEGATKALAQGGIFGPVLAATVIAAGMVQVANIASTETPRMKGYKEGGAIVGENGVEIIAPAQDFASGMAELVNRSVGKVEDYLMGKAVVVDRAAAEIRALVYGGSANSDLINEIKLMRDEFKKFAEKPLEAVAYLDHSEARRIYREGKRAEGRERF